MLFLIATAVGSRHHVLENVMGVAPRLRFSFANTLRGVPTQAFFTRDTISAGLLGEESLHWHTPLKVFLFKGRARPTYECPTGFAIPDFFLKQP